MAALMPIETPMRFIVHVYCYIQKLFEDKCKTKKLQKARGVAALTFSIPISLCKTRNRY